MGDDDGMVVTPKAGEDAGFPLGGLVSDIVGGVWLGIWPCAW